MASIWMYKGILESNSEMCDCLRVITKSNSCFLIAQWIAQAHSSLGQ